MQFIYISERNNNTAASIFERSSGFYVVVFKY